MLKNINSVDDDDVEGLWRFILQRSLEAGGDGGILAA